ncbi:hypothetical protein EBT31_02905 [bacterium]|nr:hypothetical protein [bacterium]NBX48635.1 hypothetical protein [bacterium]
MGKVILTCFAGRKRYLEVLFQYIPKLKVDEVHIWDYTRESSDSTWLNSHCPYEIIRPLDKSTWKEYYMYYTSEKYAPDDIIIKCDDDIVFIDTDQFDTFIENRRANPECLVAFAGIVNNRVCGLLHSEQKILPFSEQDINLVYFSTEMCKMLHDYFVHNSEGVCARARKNGGVTHLTPDRLSNMCNINFIAVLGKDLWAFQECWEQDEDKLSLTIPMEKRKLNYVDTSFTVSHMAFTQQRAAGFDEIPFLNIYKNLVKQ